MTAALFWSFYLAIGVITLIFMMTSYEFYGDTPWWRRILSMILTVVFWPVLVIILAFT